MQCRPTGTAENPCDDVWRSAPRNIGKCHDARRNPPSPKRLKGAETPLTCDETTFGRDDNGLQEKPELLNLSGKAIDIAEGPCGGARRR